MKQIKLIDVDALTAQFAQQFPKSDLPLKTVHGAIGYCEYAIQQGLQYDAVEYVMGVVFQNEDEKKWVLETVTASFAEWLEGLLANNGQGIVNLVLDAANEYIQDEIKKVPSEKQQIADEIAELLCSAGINAPAITEFYCKEPRLANEVDLYLWKEIDGYLEYLGGEFDYTVRLMIEGLLTETVWNAFKQYI